MEVPLTRITIAAPLRGEGIEIGAGHWPFPTPVGVGSVKYVSRHSPQDERRLFPEVSEEHDFGIVDVIADMDRDGLAAFSDHSQDFVIASHVVEHLAAPIWAISEFIRVVRPGGYIVLVLPDRRLTFDRDRDPTPIEHLIREHSRGVREVDDLHVREFLAKTGGGMQPSGEEIALHRERSVHAHCWTDIEFRDLLRVLISDLGFPLVIDGSYDATAADGTGIEFAYRLRVTFESADQKSSSRQSKHEGLRIPDAEAASRIELENAALRNELASVYRSRTWRLGALPRAIRRIFDHS